MNRSYNKSVFLNCPIDGTYNKLLHPSVFVIIRCGFNVRYAEEESDSSEIRLNKIFRMIKESRFGIHDLSYTKLDKKTKFPRFNMPLELGLFLSAKHFSKDEQARKNCLIFESIEHTYEKYISDIKGQDISFHKNSPTVLITKIRNWLNTNSKIKSLPGGNAIVQEYKKFLKWLPNKCHVENLKLSELEYNDYVNLVYAWIDSKYSN